MDWNISFIFRLACSFAAVKERSMSKIVMMMRYWASVAAAAAEAASAASFRVDLNHHSQGAN
jgi:hypothetical protein